MLLVPARPLWFQASLKVRNTFSGSEQKIDLDLGHLPSQLNLFEPEILFVSTYPLHRQTKTFVPKLIQYLPMSPIDPPDPPTKLKVDLVTKNTVTLSWEPPKNNGGSPVKHYIIEKLSWDTSGKEKETWKQCNKRDVEELTFIVEDVKEVSITPLCITCTIPFHLIQ